MQPGIFADAARAEPMELASAIDDRQTDIPPILKKMDREEEVKHWGSDWGRVHESSAPQIVHQPRDTSGSVTQTEPLPTVEGLCFSVLVS